MNKSIQFVKFTTTLNAYDCLTNLPRNTISGLSKN